MLCWLFSVLATMIVVKIVYCGGVPIEGKVTGWRKYLVGYSFYLCTYTALLSLGIIPSTETIEDADYSEWLGKNYKFEPTKSGVVSTVVCNHMSFIDILVLLFKTRGQIGFLAASEFRKFPVLGTFCIAIDTLFV
jgi:hypothetical protein